MKLLLTSAGLATDSIKKRFLEMVGKRAEDITVALIPTAADPETDKWFIDKDKKVLEGMGVKIKEMDLKEGDIRLGDADAVWVEGGNTFYLLYWVRKSGFDKELLRFLDRGGTYVGVSAGSLLVGPSIETASWKGGDDPSIVELENYNGLGLVKFTIFPHYEDKYAELVRRESRGLPYEVKTLTNEQAVAVDGERVEMV
ncbi:MAG: dipeptidase E [Microgenomates group bacterium Gr01-1014_16]|nr:MAG: dipeptidase E [Microgenomates group bacterium Gr01-1014_16]